MPSFIASYSVSEEIEDIVSAKLFNEMEKSVKILEKGTGDQNRDREEIATLATSALKVSYQKNSLQLLKSLINKLGCIRDEIDVASTLGDFCRYRINTILSIFSGPESEHSTKIRTCIGGGSLGLPDVSYYKATAPGKMRALLGYIRLLRKLGTDFDIPNLELVASLESSCVTPLAKSYTDNEDSMKGSEMAKKWGATPWPVIFEAALGLTPSEASKSTFLILAPTWIKYINTLFKTLTVQQWKIWFAGNLLLHALPILPPPYDDMHFELFGKSLRGQTEKIPQKNLALLLCQQWLPTSLGKVFEECCLDHDIVRDAKKIAENIREAYIERLRVTEWLKPQTRRKAISKVRKVYFGIGVPEEWPEQKGLGDDNLALVKDNLLKNLLVLGERRTLTDIEATKHPLNPRAWEDPCFAVNAFYYNEGNRLIIPGGILQYPFITKKRERIGWNYGGIGATIGHELTHAFDVDGKEYNERGNTQPWWEPSDNRAYNATTKSLIELFTGAKYKDHPVNGTLTLSENIADLGGVSVALAALEDVIKDMGEKEKKQQYVDFFTSYAVSWRIKEKEAASLQGLIMDRHAPAILRVNLVVAQMEQWYVAFDVKEGDELFIPVGKRVRIF